MDVLGGREKLLTLDTKPEDEILVRSNTEVWTSPISHF